MSFPRRRFSSLPLVGISFVLLVLPSSISQKARLTLLSGYLPFQQLGRASSMAPTSILPSQGNEEIVRQNEFYRDEIVKYMNEVVKLQGQLNDISNLKPILKEHSLALLHADVVLPTDGSPWRRSLTLAIGTNGGARKGMLVLYNNQLVGRVSEAGPWTSRVQLVIDPGFRAGAVAVPKTYTAGVSFEKRHIGVYEGTSGEYGSLKWLTGDTPVEAGAYVLTTEDPLNGVPRGLILGRVASLAAARGAFPKVEVEPMLNFRALEHVMLLTRTEGP